jgi:hypothetical protein
MRRVVYPVVLATLGAMASACWLDNEPLPEPHGDWSKRAFRRGAKARELPELYGVVLEHLAQQPVPPGDLPPTRVCVDVGEPYPPYC